MTPEERARKQKELQLLELDIQIAEAEKSQPAPEVSAREKNRQYVEDINTGSTGKRFLRGMTDPLTGISQGLFETFKDYTDLDEAMGITSESMKKEMLDMNAKSSRGQRALGRGEFDLARLGGNIVTGSALAAPTAGLGVGGATLSGGMLGAAMPVTSDDYWSSKQNQIAAGALGGSAGYALGQGLGWVGGKIAPYFRSATKQTGRAIREAVGEEKVDAVLAALRADINPLTKGSAGEVASGAGSTRFSALQRAVDKEILPDELAARQAAQSAARMGVVDDLAGGHDDAVAYRALMTDPMRTQSLNNAAANTTKSVGLVDDIAAQERKVQNAVRERYGLEGTVNQVTAKSKNYSPVPGQPKVPPRYTPHQDMLEVADDFIDDAKVVETLTKSTRDMLKYQQDSMKALGIEPSSGGPIVEGIRRAMGSPAVKGNPTLGKLMAKISKDLKGMADDNGIIHPESLYEFRKSGLDTTISRFMSNADDGVKKRMAGEISSIKPMLDDVIEKAAGGGWKDYLATYTKLSKPVDQAKVGRVLQQALGDSLDDVKIKPRVFTNALDDAKGTLKKAKVLGKTLDDVLDEGQIDQVGRLRADLTRSAEYERLYGLGSSVGRDAMGTNEFQLANPLIREIMVTNAALKKLSERQQGKVMAELGRLFKRDPEMGFKLLADAIEGGVEANSFITKLGIDAATAAARPAAGVASGRGLGR